MTIICIKDGVVAADGASWQGSVKAETGKLKIVRSRDGALGAACGDACCTEFFRVWFALTEAREQRGFYRSKDDPLVIDKDDRDDRREFRSAWLEPDGDVIIMEHNGRPYLAGRGPLALGAAEGMAFGAMYAGASAEEAVRVCVERHADCGGEVFVERLASAEPAVVLVEGGNSEPSFTLSQPASETAQWSDVDKTKQQAVNDAWREKMGLA
jgi:hypothetical protein